MTRHILILFLCVLIQPAPAQNLPTDGPLTINPQLQALATRLLKGKQGSMVALEPQTGRVLAMVNADRIDDGVNRAIEMAYNPGSTFKVAQALEMCSEGVLQADKTYPCYKGFSFNNIRIGCHPHRSNLALVQAIGQSCNSYFCKAFQEMIDNRLAYPTQFRAIERWAQYMRSYGLGQPLGIDLPGEVGGQVPDSAFLRQQHPRWNGTTIMWVGMGQGEIKATPLQLCNLAALVANRGWWIAPHIHEGTAERPLDAKYTERHKALGTNKAFDLVIQGMRACITGGTAASINTPDYKICGKTGTAENVGDDHSIFIAFAPMDDPQIAVSVYVENGGFGADLAAPMAALLIEQQINGQLSAASEQKAKRWEKKAVKVTPKEVEINFDDL